MKKSKLTAEKILSTIEDHAIKLIKEGDFEGQFALVDVLIELGYTDEQLERLSEKANPKWIAINARAKELELQKVAA